MNEADAYAAVMGEAALARQREASRERHGCCWLPLDGPHHPACRKAKPREETDETATPLVPEVGQTAFL